MSSAYAGEGYAETLPQLRLEALRNALIWLTALSGAFVFIEPSPYEVVASLTIIVFAMTGLSLRTEHLPLIALLILINIGYALAVVQVITDSKAVIWVCVSAFLAATAIFYAAVLG